MKITRKALGRNESFVVYAIHIFIITKPTILLAIDTITDGKFAYVTNHINVHKMANEDHNAHRSVVDVLRHRTDSHNM